MDKQLTVLVTRPQPGADAFAAMLEGMRVVISPVLGIEAVTADLGAPDVVVITSSHGIAALSALDRGTPVYCVGCATTERARAAGLAAHMGGETAQDVAARIIRDRPEGRVVYPRGRHVAFDMVGALASAGLRAEEVVTYDQTARPLSAAALGLLDGRAPVIVPLFSARSAEIFFDACPDAAHLQVVAISDAVAQTVPERHMTDMQVAPNPDATAMARMVRNAASGGKRLEQGQ